AGGRREGRDRRLGGVLRPPPRRVLLRQPGDRARRGRSLPGPDLVRPQAAGRRTRSQEHTSELQSQSNLVCRLLLEKKKKTTTQMGTQQQIPLTDDISRRLELAAVVTVAHTSEYSSIIASLHVVQLQTTCSSAIVPI